MKAARGASGYPGVALAVVLAVAIALWVSHHSKPVSLDGGREAGPGGTS